MLPLQPPQVFSMNGLRLYFPVLGSWVAQSISLPSFSSWFICTQIWDLLVHQPPPCLPWSTSCSVAHLVLCCCLVTPPLYPCSWSLPLLPVWTNVSSLFPWLSDFHAVRFSVSSGCFLFLNCPSFGCARRHTMSTYASILAGSPEIKQYFERLLNYI